LEKGTQLVEPHMFEMRREMSIVKQKEESQAKALQEYLVNKYMKGNQDQYLDNIMEGKETKFDKMYKHFMEEFVVNLKKMELPSNTEAKIV
jgi:hypothetical protein